MISALITDLQERIDDLNRQLDELTERLEHDADEAAEETTG